MTYADHDPWSNERAMGVGRQSSNIRVTERRIGPFEDLSAQFGDTFTPNVDAAPSVHVSTFITFSQGSSSHCPDGIQLSCANFAAASTYRTPVQSLDESALCTSQHGTDIKPPALADHCIDDGIV